MSRRFIAILVFTLLQVLMSARVAKAIPVASINPSDAVVNLAPLVEIGVDREREWNAEDLLVPADPRFTPSGQAIINFGYTSSAIWSRTLIRNASDEWREFFLEVAYPALDRIDLYEVESQGKGLRHRVYGDKMEFSKREVRYRNVVFLLRLEPREERLLLVRTETTSSMQVPLLLWHSEAFFTDSLVEQITFGLLYGLMWAMIIYNLFLYFSTRDKAYLFYCLYFAPIGLFAGTVNGHTFQFLWPNSTWWASQAVPVLCTLGLFGSQAFAREFLSTRQTSPITDKLVIILMAVTLSLAGASVLASPLHTTSLGAILTIVNSIFLLYVAAQAWAKGFRPARFYTLAWVVVLIGVALFALKSLGLVPSYPILQYGLDFGLSMESVLMSFALGDRIQLLKLEREKAQQTALVAKEEALAINKRLLETQNQALENMRRADKVKDEFLANTSHELRTPLVGILGIAQLLLNDTEHGLSEAVRRNLSLIVQSARRLSVLINDILDFSRLREQKIEIRPVPVNLKEAVSVVLGVLDPLAREKKLALTNEISAGCPHVLADPDRLAQIITNLVGNAVKFTSIGFVKVTARELPSQIELCIQDSGPGIAVAFRERIFRPFEQGDTSSTRKHGGTGLGLAVTRDLVELHGGKIRLDSEEGSGSSFFVTLPKTMESALPLDEDAFELSQQRLGEVEITPALQEEIEPAAIEASARLEGTVLVVDDEVVNRQVLSGMLARCGFRALLAEGGDTALKILSREPLPDVVLLDVMMPQMNGNEVCARLRKLYRPSELPVIFLTARNQLRNLMDAFAAGGNDYVTKPFLDKELIARVRVHRDLARAHRSSHKLGSVLTGVLAATQEMCAVNDRKRAVRIAVEAILAGTKRKTTHVCRIGFRNWHDSFFKGLQWSCFHVDSYPGSGCTWELYEGEAMPEPPTMDVAALQDGAAWRMIDGDLHLVVKHGGRLAARVCLAGIQLDELSGVEGQRLDLLAHSLFVVLAELRATEERDEERKKRAESEKQGLLKVVAMAVAISDKLNSPLSTLVNGFEMVRRSRLVGRTSSDHFDDDGAHAAIGKESPDEFSGLKIDSSMDEAMAKLKALSVELAEIREEGEKIEATTLLGKSGRG